MPQSVTTVEGVRDTTPRRPRPINVGIIGFGRMGHIRYEAAARNGQGRMVAIADSERAAAEETPGIRHYALSEALINDPEVEGVFICIPTHLNRLLTTRALRAGKHVFCEKGPRAAHPRF